MKKTLLLLLFPAFVLTAPAVAAAGPTLNVSFSAPSVDVYQTGTYTVTVSNTGNRHANGVTLDIQLPETNTSPTVHIMGALSGHSSKCSQSGTSLSCSLGRVRKNKSKSVSFDIALPYSTAPIVFDATASASNASDSSQSLTASPSTINTNVGAPRVAINTLCTGTGLTSYWDCVVSPSSTQTFTMTMETNGSIGGLPVGMSGTWAQTAADAITIELFQNGTLGGTLDAKGVGNDCFEGVMQFPLSPPWVSPYEICLQ